MKYRHHRSRAGDANFAYYQLLVRPAGAPDIAWRELSRSYTPVAGGVLGRVDTTTLANGMYQQFSRLGISVALPNI